MEIAQSVNLQAYNTFRVPATAAFFATIESKENLEKALQYAAGESLPTLELGGGSNVLFIRDYAGLVLHINNRGIKW